MLSKAAPESFKVPKTRTIYEWYRKTLPGGDYAVEFDFIVNSLSETTPGFFRLNANEIDEWLTL